ncbi:MAG: polyprenyl synthetase family protein [Clostridia bacterium]|nr:polyprenyl synthetase family protein [Clostridia bacterium]
MKPIEENDLTLRIREDADAVEQALSVRWLADVGTHAPLLGEAMRWAVLGGGKRVRAFLCLEIARILAPGTDALDYACALELLHASSLVHDDMPEMDNDDIRRGKPSCHKQFGPAIALMAGDALIALAFRAAAGDADRAAEAVSVLSEAGGWQGIASGQTLDLLSEGRRISLEELKTLQRLKTGRLIVAAAELGALAARASAEKTRDFAAYAEAIGQAFQVTDDLLDAGESGSDRARDLATFLRFMTPEEALAYAAKLTEKGKDAIRKYPGTELLLSFADRLLARTC